jgi:hypothetical protein
VYLQGNLGPQACVRVLEQMVSCSDNMNLVFLFIYDMAMSFATSVICLQCLSRHPQR